MGCLPEKTSTATIAAWRTTTTPDQLENLTTSSAEQTLNTPPKQQVDLEAVNDVEQVKASPDPARDHLEEILEQQKYQGTLCA